MTTFYVLLVMWNGSAGYVEAPIRHTTLAECQSEGRQNAALLKGVRWKCEKRAIQ